MPVYPSYDSTTGGLVYHVVPDPPTNAQSISDIVSETESDMSGMTIVSDDVPEYFIEYYGRQQPASENAIRWFPADNTRRYILRHVVDKYVLGFNYFGPVKEVLTGPGRNALEIGTRDGTWTQEMAAEFPHVQFRSVDIAPIIAHVPQQNILFEVYDIGEGLMVEDNSQDCVFVNMSVELVRDYQALLREVYRVLKPGGLLHVREFSPGIWDPRNEFKIPRATAPLACQLFDIIRQSMINLGADPDMCDKLPAWLRPGSELWEGCDLKAGFERIGSIVKSCATYPHDNHPCSAKIDRRFGPLIGHLYWVCLRDSLGMLRESGLSDEEANKLIADVIEESKNPEKCTLWKMNAVPGFDEERHAHHRIYGAREVMTINKALGGWSSSPPASEPTQHCPMGCIPSKKSLSTPPEMCPVAIVRPSQLNAERISIEKLDELLLHTPSTPLSPSSTVKPSVSLTDQAPLPRRPDCIAPRPPQPQTIPERRNKADQNIQDQGGNTATGAVTAFGAVAQGDAAVAGAGGAGGDGGGDGGGE